MKDNKAAITLRSTCRVCGSGDLMPILSLGEQYSVGFLDSANETTAKAPLDLVLCNIKGGGCGLLQLHHTLDHDILYHRYWYKSGISKTMVAALADVVAAAERMASLKPNDLVVDIGSNDGTLLRQYKAHGIAKIGFEPSNLWELGVGPDTTIIHDYFNHQAFQKHFGDRKARIITSIAMFYDLEDPNQFVADINRCFDDNGLWIIQMNYLGLMLDNHTFDNISHEHLEYYSLISLENLLKRHNLVIVDVDLNDVNGGSYRAYVKKVLSKPPLSLDGKERVDRLRNKEIRQGYDGKTVYDNFSREIRELKDQLVNFLLQEVKRGKTTYIYGASTRGLVVIQYAGLDHRLIKAAVDMNPDKWGKYIVGAGIQIIPFKDYRQSRPDYLLVLPYHFKNEIIHQEREFLDGGGKMIFALPVFEVVDKSFFTR